MRLTTLFVRCTNNARLRTCSVSSWSPNQVSALEGVERPLDAFSLFGARCRREDRTRLCTCRSSSRLRSRARCSTAALCLAGATAAARARDLRLWPGVHRAQEALVDIRTGDTMTDMNRDTVACLKDLVADLRTHVVGNRSAMGLCSDLAYFLYDFIHTTVPDVRLVYGGLVWRSRDRREPIAHWWVDSPQLGVLLDAANPFEADGYVGAIDDPRYLPAQFSRLTRRDLSELQAAYLGLDLDDTYYRRFCNRPRRR